MTRGDAKAAELVRPMMPELDTVRGIAVLMVLFDHYLWWENSDRGNPAHLTRLVMHAASFGARGVTLFFVLSGFLITGLLVQSRSRPDYYQRFYWRRALRILPPYMLLLVVLALTGMASPLFLGLSLLFCANFTPMFPGIQSYGVLWSLAVEEHFYLLWPTAARRFSDRGLLRLAVGIVLGSIVLRAAARSFWDSGATTYTWFEADGLAIGAALALFIRRPEVTRAQVLKWALGAAALSATIAVAGAPFGVLTRRSMVGAALSNTMLSLLFVAFLAFVLLLGTSPWARIVNRPILQFYGRISYGLYLIHVLVYEQLVTVLGRYAPEWGAIDGRALPLAFRFCVAAALSTGIAYLSRWFYEEPFLRLKDRLGPGARRQPQLGDSVAR